MTTAGAPAKQRVFVALWPSDEVRLQLDAIGQKLALQAPAARRVAAANLHLTLAFIGWLESDRVAELAPAIATIAVEPFTWQIDHLGHFARAHVVWAGGAASPALESLASRVRAALDERDVGYDAKPFAAHVTLLRDVRHWRQPKTTIVPPIDWQVRRAVVVRSHQIAAGVSYQPISA
jgi:2'-5' RNA ligase